MNSPPTTDHIQTVVIGGGQSGLAVGYHLARLGVPFVILEADARVGDVWRRRWDSLRLFTPARFDGIAGWPFPAAAGTFPTKDEMGDYLEEYAKRFGLPVRTGVRVDRVWQDGSRFIVSAGTMKLEADNVVVAMATYQQPRIPDLASGLGAGIRQLHSRDYRNPGQLRPGGVLVVGAGNSGSEIAREVAGAGHPTWLSGRDTGHVPFRIESAVARHALIPLLFRVVFHRVLSLATPIGRKVRPRIVSRGAPLIRVKPKDLVAAGVRRVPRTTGTRGGLPELADGQALDVTNVIWCTGFEPGFSWIDLPAFDHEAEPMQRRGIVAAVPGLFFVGLHFLYALSSTMIHGVTRDAEHVAKAVAARGGAKTAAPPAPRLAAAAR